MRRLTRAKAQGWRLLDSARTIAVVGEPTDGEVTRVLRAIRGGYRPNKVVACGAGSADVGLLRDKPGRGAVTTYICANFTCQEPLVGAEALEAKVK